MKILKKLFRKKIEKTTPVHSTNRRFISDEEEKDDLYDALYGDFHWECGDRD